MILLAAVVLVYSMHSPVLVAADRREIRLAALASLLAHNHNCRMVVQLNNLGMRLDNAAARHNHFVGNLVLVELGVAAIADFPGSSNDLLAIWMCCYVDYDIDRMNSNDSCVHYFDSGHGTVALVIGVFDCRNLVVDHD